MCQSDFQSIVEQIKAECRVYDETLHKVASEFQWRFEGLIKNLESIEGVKISPVTRRVLIKNLLGSYDGCYDAQVKLNLEYIYSDFLRGMSSLHLEDY